MKTILQPNVDYRWKAKPCAVHRKETMAHVGDLVTHFCRRCGRSMKVHGPGRKILGVQAEDGIVIRNDAGYPMRVVQSADTSGVGTLFDWSTRKPSPFLMCTSSNSEEDD